MQQSWSAPSGLTTTRSQPLPSGAVVARRPLQVVVGTDLDDISVHVDVVVRSSGAPEQRTRAQSTSMVPPSGLRWFAGHLPVLGNGERAEYRVELLKLTRCLARLPADGSWIQLIGQEAVGTEVSAPVTVDTEARSHRRWSYDMSFLGRSTVNLRVEEIGPAPDGFRVNFYANGGTLVGPRVNAVLVEGADIVCVRPDGMAVLNVRALWKNTDGAVLFAQGVGMTDLGPDGYEVMASGQWSGNPPLTLAHSWLSAHPDWAWLNRHQTLALGRTLTDALQVQTDIYFPVIGDRLPNA